MDKYDLKVIFWVIVVLSLLLLAVNYYEEYRCNNYEEVTGRESKWIFMDECYVKNNNDIWIRYDSKYKE